LVKYIAKGFVNVGPRNTVWVCLIFCLKNTNFGHLLEMDVIFWFSPGVKKLRSCIVHYLYVCMYVCMYVCLTTVSISMDFFSVIQPMSGSVGFTQALGQLVYLSIFWEEQIIIYFADIDKKEKM